MLEWMETLAFGDQEGPVRQAAQAGLATVPTSGWWGQFLFKCLIKTAAMPGEPTTMANIRALLQFY